jgi:uncharacterized protein YkwD
MPLHRLPLLGAALLLIVLAPLRAGADQRAEIEGSLREAFARAGLAAPSRDQSLDKAALALARRALDGSVHDATGAEQLAVEMSRAGAWDPPPRTIVVKTSPAARASSSLGARPDLAATSATHFGLGLAIKDDTAAAVLLLTDRKAFLEPFPRKIEVAGSAQLTGRLVFPLHDARVFVTGPDGEAKQARVEAEARNRFSARLGFPERGRYSIEVVGESVKGPEVVALFQVQAGEPSATAPSAPRAVPETADLKRAEAQVITAINERRHAHQLPALARSSQLDVVAAEHAAEMVRLGYFAHVSPVHGDVGERLKRAGFSYRRVSENLGEASSALEAHQLIEASPGHLANVIDPKVDLVGIGTARVKRGLIENVILVEVFARPQR